MSFHFTLKPLLNLRLNERRLCEQALAVARANHAELVSARAQLTERRVESLERIRQLNDGESLDVVQTMNLQRHVELLEHDIECRQAEIVAAAEQLAQKSSELLQANQLVDALEKLHERKFAEFQAGQLKSELREVDDLIAHRFRR